VICFVWEFMVTKPPHEKGPRFGLPLSSSAKFQAMMQRAQLRKIPAKRELQNVQLV